MASADSSYRQQRLRPESLLAASPSSTSKWVSCSARESLCLLPTPAIQSPEKGTSQYQYQRGPLQSGVGSPHSVPCLCPKKKAVLPLHCTYVCLLVAVGGPAPRGGTRMCQCTWGASPLSHDTTQHPHLTSPHLSRILVSRGSCTPRLLIHSCCPAG